jgi:hypothetical protein
LENEKNDLNFENSKDIMNDPVGKKLYNLKKEQNF